jgi:Sec-independent protein translocase protein TatA
MEIFGIGPLEFLLIMLLALIILGPKEMQNVGKKIGQGLNKLVKSDTWKTVRQASEKMRTLPNDLMRDAELDELKKNFKDSLDEANKIAPPPPEEKADK